MALTYASYLKVDDLLKLQVPKSEPEQHDELLFITIHQVYELWFKQMLHELGKVAGDFDRGDTFGAIATLKRLCTIMKTLVGQLDILETMTPLSFSSFRDRLESSSGFQSVQFREFEYVLGYKRPDMLKYHAEGGEGRLRLERKLREPSLVDHFYNFLAQHGVDVPDALRKKDAEQPNVADESMQDEILRLYKSRGELQILFELMTDFDEGLQEWRYRHVKLVERAIGNKKGSGGSLGVDFLKRSLFLSIFPDLWAIRHRL
ncbi:MAG: tryptophan 2,3-dioxygenase [Acidobacteria bacterium]|uniref:Tryptophan 2,3-dioxygenase n=1 Tax=Candidatus Polarisedimenticola svalbardensis TaxID=2886004 RepID=A0A8J7C1V0_9BACT|nr:tryptophan 2,3-dioxygenase [Candidatus Polarisedimenticola svalbardensis]